MLMRGGRIASRLARAILSPFPVRVRSGSNRGMTWIVGAGIHRCWLGTYESEKQNAIARFISAGMTLYDVGAHSGFYTLLFSRLHGSARSGIFVRALPGGPAFSICDTLN